MKSIESRLNEYASVPGFSCPAEFWPALGYEGEARYVAIWWEPAGDEACYGDGKAMLCGAAWPTYLALLDHNFPADHPAHWLLGSSETPATCHLVIDRLTEWAWLVAADQADGVLMLQWPAHDVVDGLGALSFEALMELAQSLRAREPVALEEIERRMAEEFQRYEAFAAVLAGRRGERLPQKKPIGGR